MSDPTAPGRARVPPGWDAVPRLSPGETAATSAGRGRGRSPVAGRSAGRTAAQFLQNRNTQLPRGRRPQPRGLETGVRTTASRQLRPLASHCCGENPPRTRRLKRGEFLLLRIWTPQVREASQGTGSPRGCPVRPSGAHVPGLFSWGPPALVSSGPLRREGVAFSSTLAMRWGAPQ